MLPRGAAVGLNRDVHADDAVQVLQSVALVVWQVVLGTMPALGIRPPSFICVKAASSAASGNVRPVLIVTRLAASRVDGRDHRRLRAWLSVCGSDRLMTTRGGG